MNLYMQEAQDYPFDFLKKKILVHSFLESIYEDFYRTCLLLIQKNSSCTKEGGHLSHEDLCLIEKRVSRIIEEESLRLRLQIAPFFFMMRFSLMFSIFGFLHAISLNWNENFLSSDLSFLLLGLLNWMISFSCHYFLDQYICSIIQGTTSLFLRIMQSVEIQYKKVKTF